MSFGTDPLQNQYEIKLLNMIDPKQFAIMNINGSLYMIDTSVGKQLTRIKVESKPATRLNTSDYIDLGF